MASSRLRGVDCWPRRPPCPLCTKIPPTCETPTRSLLSGPVFRSFRGLGGYIAGLFSVSFAQTGAAMRSLLAVCLGLFFVPSGWDSAPASEPPKPQSTSVDKAVQEHIKGLSDPDPKVRA